MRLRRLSPALALVILAVAAPPVSAHPLGNFSVNHLTRVGISSDRVDLLYILDQAEIPTFQERGLSRAQILDRKRAAIRRGLLLSADGRRLALRVGPGEKLTFPPGQGGLKLTRLELPLSARVKAPARIELEDRTFADRLGWKAIVARPGEGTAVRSSAPAGDPTNGLRSYPKGLLDSPLDQRRASFDVRPGGGTLVAAERRGATPAVTRSDAEDGFAGVFDRATSGQGLLALLLAASFAWGAFHALAPGHGKAMVAAYLIGVRGTMKHAVALGAIVTVTHTIGVFALGFVTLLLSQHVLPEDLYPWLNLVSGLLVVVIGLGVLRARLRWHGQRRAPAPRDAGHAQGHPDAHPTTTAGRSQGPTHPHHHHGLSDAGHHDHMPDRLTWRGLLGMGASAGLIPCPSALVVLLAAVSQQEVALGLLLIVAFSLGLAGTLTVLGLVVVYAGGVTSRHSFGRGLAATLPALSAVVIVGVGCVLTVRAVGQVL